MNALLRSASALGLATAALSAHAVDAYNNLGPSPASYSSASALAIGSSSSQGPQFTATATGVLSGFQVAMNNTDSNGPEAYALSLYADSGSNTLGNLLGTYSGTSTGVSSRNTTFALSSVAATGTAVRIASGAKYWLVASAPASSEFSPLGWNFSLVGTGPRYNGSGYDTFNTPAFSVQVNPVPEPSAFAALGLGAAALVKRRKRA